MSAQEVAVGSMNSQKPPSSEQTNGFIPAPLPVAELTTNEDHKYIPLSHAISHGDLQGVKDFLDSSPAALTAWIDATETPLLKACLCGQVEIVKEILRRMSPEQVLTPREKETHLGHTPLIAAAITGNLEVATALMEKNPKLAEIPDSLGRFIPVVKAANAGHKEMTRFLYHRTPLPVLLSNQCHSATPLLHNALFYGILDIALDLLKECPRLAIAQHPFLSCTPLEILASKPDLFLSGCNLKSWQRLIYSFMEATQPPDSNTSTSNQYQGLITEMLQRLSKWFGINRIYELKAMHYSARNLLERTCKQISTMVKDEYWTKAVPSALLTAVRNGNKDFVVEMIKSSPDLLWSFGGKTARSFFHLAVEYRKEKIFELVYGLDERKTVLLKQKDKEGNLVLHIAGGLSPDDELSRIVGAALKMQRELQWFKEIESMLPDIEKVMPNNKDLKPRKMFEDSHEPLRKKAEEWMKGTATSCSLVAALIATVTFQAIFTVPGGTEDKSGDPIHLRDARFMVFIVADTVSFFFSCTSALIFLCILTDRYSFDDFLVSLPSKMIAGLSTLFISVAAMLVAFSTALYTVLHRTPWLAIPVLPVACLPTTLFVFLQYPLLKEMISATYGKGIFNRDPKPWF